MLILMPYDTTSIARLRIYGLLARKAADSLKDSLGLFFLRFSWVFASTHSGSVNTCK